MKMAKANEQDMTMALELSHFLDDVEKGYMPERACEPEQRGDTVWLNIDDGEQASRVLRELKALCAVGSLFRVVFGMFVLLDPANEVLDPAADTLEVHPKFEQMNRLLQNCRFALDTLLTQQPGLVGKVCGETTLGNLRAELAGFRQDEAGGAEKAAAMAGGAGL